MIKRMLTALLAGCMMIIAAGCGAKPQSSSMASDKSWNQIQAAKKLVVGVEANFAPLSFEEKGEPDGFGPELAKNTTKKLGIAVEFITLPPEELDKALEDKKIDCIWSSYSRGSQRTDTDNLSFAYLTSNQVILCLKDNTAQNLADLKDQRVGVKQNSGGQKALENSTAFKDCLESIGEYEDFEEAKTSLDNKKISAVVMDEFSAAHYVQQNPDQYKLLGQAQGKTPELLETGEYCVKFRTGDGSLALKVEEAIMDLVKDGELSAMSQRWFNQDLSVIQKNG